MSHNKQLKVCVLLPDYSTSAVDYQHYDPPRDLSPLLPQATVDHVFLNKLTTYKQLKALSSMGYDIFVNLCEGYLEWEVPSIDVIYFLELLQLPFTGPNSILYDPPKELMKYVAYTVGVDTPDFFLIDKTNIHETAVAKLNYPLFVKPAKAGDSLGISDDSLIQNPNNLQKKVTELLNEYAPVLVEEYIDGREFTVMVIRNQNAPNQVHVFQPVEYVFPEKTHFKTYKLKTSELHTDANKLVQEPKIIQQLQTAATAIFNAFEGVGYARLDFRMDKNGKLFFLEINFTCSVFYKDGYEGSADYILKMDGTGQSDFLSMIIEEGLWRYNKAKKKYRISGNAIAGYGIYATEKIYKGDVIFGGEVMAQRIVTKSHVEKFWPKEKLETFRRYAYPISDEVFILWDQDPRNWAPQNHCCNANTVYKGLQVVANRDINMHEELTLNYAEFLDEHMEPFQCSCGSNNCLGFISGVAGNSITVREKSLK